MLLDATQALDKTPDEKHEREDGAELRAPKRIAPGTRLRPNCFWATDLLNDHEIAISMDGT